MDCSENYNTHTHTYIYINLLIPDSICVGGDNGIWLVIVESHRRYIIQVKHRGSIILIYCIYEPLYRTMYQWRLKFGNVREIFHRPMKY